METIERKLFPASEEAQLVEDEEEQDRELLTGDIEGGRELRRAVFWRNATGKRRGTVQYGEKKRLEFGNKKYKLVCQGLKTFRRGCRGSNAICWRTHLKCKAYGKFKRLYRLSLRRRSRMMLVTRKRCPRGRRRKENTLKSVHIKLLKNGEVKLNLRRSCAYQDDDDYY
mmetsp:Transcript_15374/g.27048  ORF Transcript_15374/g.27048 Transcript_15374/m.27048 type:complete len:169 (-) Transcript_15374:39-545(-)